MQSNSRGKGGREQKRRLVGEGWKCFHGRGRECVFRGYERIGLVEIGAGKII